MKRGLILCVLLVFVSTLNFVSAQQISLTNLLSNEWFNAALLFLLIFVLCLTVLKKIFSASFGTALIISLILGIAGSFSIIAKYGLIFQRFDWWIILLIALLIIALLMMFSKKSTKAATIIFLFVISISWFAIGQELFCPPKGTLSSNTCTILNTLAGILFAISFLLFLLALFRKSKEMGAWTTAPRPEPSPKKAKVKLEFRTNKPKIKPGESSTLFWKTQNAVKFYINDRAFDLAGTLQVSPQVTTTYYGTAIGVQGDSVRKAVTIHVEGAPPKPPGPGPTPGPEKVKLIITINPEEAKKQGCRTVPYGPGEYHFDKGTVIPKIEAIPAGNYEFKNWKINGSTYKRKVIENLYMDKDYYLEANFSEKGGEKGSAAFEVVVGRQKTRGGEINVPDLKTKDEVEIKIRNCGEGGTLAWAAYPSKYLSLNEDKGMLEAGQEFGLKVKVLDKEKLNSYYKSHGLKPCVLIFGKRGKTKEKEKIKGKKKIARAIIYFEI